MTNTLRETLCAPPESLNMAALPKQVLTTEFRKALALWAKDEKPVYIPVGETAYPMLGARPTLFSQGVPVAYEVICTGYKQSVQCMNNTRVVVYL